MGGQCLGGKGPEAKGGKEALKVRRSKGVGILWPGHTRLSRSWSLSRMPLPKRNFVDLCNNSIINNIYITYGKGEGSGVASRQEGEKGRKRAQREQGRRVRGRVGVWPFKGYIRIYKLLKVKGKGFALKTNVSSFYKAVERVL